jgi:hypothetical protein
MSRDIPPEFAWAQAEMEEAVSRWPTEWGNRLEVLVGGDFELPKADVHVPELRITVYTGNVSAEVFGAAPAVVRVHIEVDERNLAGYNSAIERLNVLLGSQSVASWGAAGLAWWCWLRGVIRSGGRRERFGDTADLLERRLALLKNGRSHVDAALYWLREPRTHMGERTRPDAVRAFTSYWTALECLVAAACDMAPLPQPSVQEIKSAVAAISADDPRTLLADKLYTAHALLRPSLRERACHAFRQFVPEEADTLIEECFTRQPSERRLSRIRNRIAHGAIKPEDLNSLAIVEPAEGRLRGHVVWPLLMGLLTRGVAAAKDQDWDAVRPLFYST